ncbi:P-loop NTPase family protein [Rhizobium ruizarguesonis]|uniref:AAA family ATPase n=1 Tax=Rhizobium ruizarguesonis TaxID=2081791 RepID=UPI0010304E34|nr:AAA family ATPase [Rhizobium ruizarguesonis]TBD21824.1 AAA family ATPase [Rhizobium ruizarguesonis]
MYFANAKTVFERVLIMGNGGSGKTWLARRIGEQLRYPIIHLDDIHWEPGGYGTARDKTLRDEMVIAAGKGDYWIMEGVYGQLVNLVLNRVTALIWIDLPEEACIANVKERGIQGGGTQTQFIGLLKWVAEYRTRANNWNSFDAHAQLYLAFPGPKWLLSDREAVTRFANRLPVGIEVADE